MNVEKWHHSEIRISINDESQGSIAKNLRCNELLYYIFIIHSAGERILKIGEHLAKLRAKSLTVSHTPFALHFCPQKCRSRQISWKLVYYRQKLLFSVAMSTGRLMWVNYQEISNCCIPVLTYWQTYRTDAVSDWLTADHVRHFATTAFLCCGSCVQWVMGFFYMADVNNFLLLN